MARKITIRAGTVTAEAELGESRVAGLIYEALPIEAPANLWGEEIYFEIEGVDASLDETAQELVQVGDLGYWPTGRAFCIFFGPTPVSAPGEIRPASRVNIVGRIIGDAKVLLSVKDGETVKLEKAD